MSAMCSLSRSGSIHGAYQRTGDGHRLLSAPGANPVSVNYAFGGGMAGESIYDDFSAIDGTLRFAPGTTTQTVRVDLSAYQGVEPAESFYMWLSSPVNASIANNAVWATIVDNDKVVTDANSSGTIESPEKANLSVRDVVVDEKEGTATFYLTLNKATTEAFSVAYSTATVAGTATAGADFGAASGSIGFAAGQTSQSVTLSILDDAAAESNEYFHLALGALSGSGANQVALADGVGTALIGRNDQTALASPLISATPIVVNEGDGYAEFVVQLSAPGTIAYVALENPDVRDAAAPADPAAFSPFAHYRTARCSTKLAAPSCGAPCAAWPSLSLRPRRVSTGYPRKT